MLPMISEPKLAVECPWAGSAGDAAAGDALSLVMQTASKTSESRLERQSLNSGAARPFPAPVISDSLAQIREPDMAKAVT
jgi:hypothetical protein